MIYGIGKIRGFQQFKKALDVLGTASASSKSAIQLKLIL